MTVHVLTDAQLADHDDAVRADERRRIIRQDNTASGHRGTNGCQPSSAAFAATTSSPPPRTTSTTCLADTIRAVLAARPVEPGEALVIRADGRVGRYQHACAGCFEPGAVIVHLAAVAQAGDGANGAGAVSAAALAPSS